VALVIFPATFVPLKKKNDKLGVVESDLDLYQASAYSSPCVDSAGSGGKGSKGSKGSSVRTDAEFHLNRSNSGACPPLLSFHRHVSLILTQYTLTLG
jgi:hypothetical protein